MMKQTQAQMQLWWNKPRLKCHYDETNPGSNAIM